MVERQWLHQVSLPGYRWIGHNYLTIHFFREAEGLSLCKRRHSCHENDAEAAVFCCAQREHTTHLRDLFGGKFGDPNDRPKWSGSRR
jgi:hypothetical protein